MTTVRGTPNLSIAATQNTAPVYEFRCLYSHDLRKKKKLWHDGSLRYHTFNKRVMVYDDSKNYIGDSHWREADELQDGTELKLDKGVLVEVGERIGETRTDLAPLLEKRRLENGPSPPCPPLWPISLAAISRSGPANPQARPKSLSDVLGISQGPIGRARFPTQSPYEQLHNPLGQNTHREGPSAKKPRIGLDKENGELREGRIDGQGRPLKANVVAPTGWSGTRTSSILQERGKAAPLKQVFDISSEDETSPLPSSPPRAVSRVKMTARKEPIIKSGFDGDDRQMPKTSMPPPRERIKTTSDVRSKVTRPKLANSKPPSVSPSTLFDRSSTRSLSCTGSSKNKLRLAVHKPRKKLMYEEFLSSSNRSDSQLQTRTPPSASHKAPIQGPQVSGIGVRRPANISTFSDLESDGEDGNGSVRRANMSEQPDAKEQERDRSLAELFAQPSSPLFMPELAAQVATEAPEQQRGDGFPSPPLAASLTATPTPNHPTIAPIVTTPTVNNASLPPPLSSLTLLDRRLMVPPSKTTTSSAGAEAPSSQPGPLRRVLSENDSPGYRRHEAAAASLIQQRSSVISPENPDNANQRPFKSPIKLTKSLSDTAARPRVHQPPTISVAEEDKAQGCGPWSRLESYLLFDWFPPGRQRLIIDSRKEISSGRMVVQRGLLSDQVDAL